MNRFMYPISITELLGTGQEGRRPAGQQHRGRDGSVRDTPLLPRQEGQGGAHPSTGEVPLACSPSKYRRSPSGCQPIQILEKSILLADTTEVLASVKRVQSTSKEVPMLFELLQLLEQSFELWAHSAAGTVPQVMGVHTGAGKVPRVMEVYPAAGEVSRFLWSHPAVVGVLPATYEVPI